MSEWCQNKSCPSKKTQSQIRGSKGNKWYQSNKIGAYGYSYWCSMGCREQWFNEHKETCMNAVGFIDKQILPLNDAWYVEYKWGNYGGDSNRRYELINKLKGVKQVITKEQAQTPEQQAQEYGDWNTIDDTQAKELAIQLGLAS